MPENKDVTTGYVTPPWLWEPAPGTAAARLMEESEAEVHQEPSGTGLSILARVQHRITGADR